ncbi:hypothetical protein B9T62_02465 [Paenibacillus donghaensis]|uniref:DUF3784 domain-containing protein n=2 Tax=Paenibacillus donghaensis TaxID=414771 RepID=A0A2Z2KA61_9BACL|nr:hypothetical protein B9T62_02465 [Paenibacillus donghaensis]
MKTEFLLIAIAFVVAALTPLLLKRRKRIKSGLPEADERVQQRFQKNTIGIISVFGIIGVISLGVFTAMGNDFINLNYIWLFLLALMLSLSIGAFISKR